MRPLACPAAHAPRLTNRLRIVAGSRLLHRRLAPDVTIEVMEQLPTPHNNFFHFALAHLPNARSLIKTQLSQAALAELQLDTLALQAGSFIDSDLRETFSDLLMKR